MSLKHICMNNRVDIWTCTLHPCTSMNHSLRYAPSMSNCTISVSITTHVIWYWHTGHAIMFSRHSVPEPLYMQCIWLGTSGNMSVLTSSVAPLLTACGCAWHTHMPDIFLHMWASTLWDSICRTVWCQAFLYLVHSLLHFISFYREGLVGTKVASLRGIRPDGRAGCKGTHGHAFVHIHAHTPARKHTHALTHAGKHPLHVCSLPPHLFCNLQRLIVVWLKW